VKRKFSNKKKRLCYNCGSTEHLIAHCPHEIKDNNYKKDKKENKTDYKKSKIVTPKNFKILNLIKFELKEN
jgi:hypothetical protein